MNKDTQSIEDLIDASDEDSSSSASAKLAKKQEEIKIKEIERLTKAKAAQMGVPYVDLFGFPISPEALSLITEEESKRYNAICFLYDGTNLRLGTTNPDNPEIKVLLDQLNDKYYTNGKIYLISDYSFEHAQELYASLPKVHHAKGVEISEEDLKKYSKEISDYKNLRGKINEVNMSDVITLMLATAIRTKASDVHVEAEEHGIAVRLRIDGVLQEAAVIEKDKWEKIISRLKLLSKVKINISDKPQDGRITIFLDKEKIEVRVSFLPTAYGESVVMRLLRPSSVGLPFDKLGLTPKAYEVLEQEIKKPNGLILTTGPTGSGKTTTLYAMLHRLNQPGTKIITLEDPVEYQLKGINQSQVDTDKGYTFAKGLRSVLRQDPDVVMVGEIRDLETAEIAVQASLTGHLVLSTLHTNDSSGVIPRLVDMGVKPYFLVPSINAVIGQRLVRKLCDNCKVEHKLSPEELSLVKKILAVISPKSGIEVPTKIPTIYKPGKGCEKCNGLSYSGRIGIYEIFTMSDNLKELTSKGAPAFKILEQAIENGMVTMLQDGVLKALEGITSLEEVYRVIGKFDYIDTLYDIVVSQTIGRGIKISKEQVTLAKSLASDIDKARKVIEETKMEEMAEIVIALAFEADTGDIHIEPSENEVKIRFRIDGLLHDIATISQEQYLQLLSKIKILAGLVTNVKKAAWDGRFAVFLENEKIDCRLSIISGGYGETVVIRLLSSQATALDMKELGMKPYVLNKVKSSMDKSKGIIITTGPTGSGKTTTLYSILNQLNKPDVKIITIEDPIEYHLDGVMQTQIDKSKDYTFASAIRSLMRQNPNVIMVGEIRDDETAKVAIEAAMTGHLVLSTIHANSAAGAISRFVGLGVDRQQLASSMDNTIGQRLVRKICPNCKKEIKPEKDIVDEVSKILASINPASGINIPKELKFYKGDGCNKCNGLGYKGRLGIYESIDMTTEMQKIIQTSGVTDNDIEQAAVKQGTVLLIQDGVLKALNGETSIDEVFRVAK